MHFNRISLILGFFASTILSCKHNQPVSNDNDIASLMKIHEESRVAHFDKKAQAMIDQFAGNMVSVNSGKIHKASPEKDLASFQSYFDAVAFKKWDDVQPPEIRFSDDHTLAYMIVDKLVVLESQDSLGKPFEETTHYAWVSVYRKQQNGSWKLECIASTNQPEVVKPLQ